MGEERSEGGGVFAPSGFGSWDLDLKFIWKLSVGNFYQVASVRNGPAFIEGNSQFSIHPAERCWLETAATFGERFAWMGEGPWPGERRNRRRLAEAPLRGERRGLATGTRPSPDGYGGQAGQATVWGSRLGGWKPPPL